MRFGIALTTLAMALAPHAVQAVQGAQGFSDENDWRDAVRNDYALETFEGFTTGTSLTNLGSLGITLEVLTGSMSSYPTVRDKDNEAGGLCNSCPMVLVNDDDLMAPGKGRIVIRPATPGMTIEGVGYFNTGGGSGLNADLTVLQFFADEGAIPIAEWRAGSPGTVEFVGLANPDSPVVRAEIGAIVPVSGEGVAGTPDFFFTIDDLQVSLVPEPETYAMLLAGLGTLVAARRFSRRYHR
jgi:hypothetical protein